MDFTPITDEQRLRGFGIHSNLALVRCLICVVMMKRLASILAVMLLASACADAQLEASFRSSKKAYVSGEPILLEYRLRNTSNISYTINTTDPNRPCSGYKIRVEAASVPTAAGCQIAGFSCLSGFVTLKPKETRTEYYVVNLDNDMKKPDHYRVSALRVLRYWEASRELIPPDERTEMSTSAELELEVVERDDSAVRNGVEMYVPDLTSDDFYTNTLAWNIVTHFASASMEASALRLSRRPETLMAAIRMLGRIGTPDARKRLAEIAAQPIPPRNEDGSWPANYGASGMAAITLAETGDRSYLPLLLHLAESTRTDDGPNDRLANEKAGFVTAAAKLGGDDAFPLAVAQLNSAEPLVRANAVSALAETRSRRAIPVLIDLLLDPDSMVSLNAAGRLVSLTHSTISATAKNGSPSVLRDEWLRWWRREGATARVYSASDCFSQP